MAPIRLQKSSSSSSSSERVAERPSPSRFIVDSHQVHVDVRTPRNTPYPGAVDSCGTRVVGEQSGAVTGGGFGEVRSDGKTLGHDINGPLKVQSSLGGAGKTQGRII
jgi:hypothetical protein